MPVTINTPNASSRLQSRTIRRILQSADVDSIDASLSDWLLALTDEGEAVAVDGKALRGAVREDGTQVRLLSAFLRGQGVTIAQREIPAKANEIPEIKPLLEPLELSGRVLTADALHTQRATLASWSRTNRPTTCSRSRRTNPRSSPTSKP